MDVINYIKNNIKNTGNLQEIRNALNRLKINISWNNSSSLYVLCSQNDADKDNFIVKQCNGLIIDKNTNKIVCHCLPLFDEKTIDDVNFNEVFEQLYDGSIMRIYNYENEWKVATTKSTDASHVNWSGENFMKLFNETLQNGINKNLDWFYNNLNKNNTYITVMVHPKNRICINYEEPQIYLLSTIDNDTGKEIECDITLKRPERFIIKDEKELIEILNKEKGGLIRVKGFDRTKIFSPNYIEIKKLRGNTHNIDYLILEKISSEEIDRFIHHFPEHKEKTYNIIDKVNSLVFFIHKSYIKRFVPMSKDTTIYNQNFDIVTNEIHRQYLENKERVTEEIVKNILYSMPSYVLGFLLNISPM